MCTPKLKPWLLAIACSLALASCQKESLSDSIQVAGENEVFKASGSDKYNTFKGPEVQVADGKARSWSNINHDGLPLEIGIELTGSLVRGLADPNHEHLSHDAIVLPLHQKAMEATHFKHIGMNWNEEGHPPPGVFTVPHFDFHFYMITSEEREAIPTYAEDPTGFDDQPVGIYAPQGYFTPPFGGTAEPQMGSHWIPVNLGDFLPFTKIMIYGTYNGKVHFIEPMITVEHMLTTNAWNIGFPTPQAYPDPGYYPSAYNMWYNEHLDRYYVSLSNFLEF